MYETRTIYASSGWRDPVAVEIDESASVMVATAEADTLTRRAMGRTLVADDPRWQGARVEKACGGYLRAIVDKSAQT